MVLEWPENEEDRVEAWESLRDFSVFGSGMGEEGVNTSLCGDIRGDPFLGELGVLVGKKDDEEVVGSPASTVEGSEMAVTAKNVSTSREPMIFSKPV